MLFVGHTFRRLATLLSPLFLPKNMILPRGLPLRKVNFRHRQRVFYERLESTIQSVEHQGCELRLKAHQCPLRCHAYLPLPPTWQWHTR